MSTSTHPSPSLRAILSHEHRDLAEVLLAVHEAFKSGDREEADRMFRQLEQRLEAHLRLEEREIIPRFARFDLEEAERLLDEHTRIRARLAEVGVGVDLHATRDTTVRALFTELVDHAAREDQLMYRWLEETGHAGAPAAAGHP